MQGNYENKLNASVQGIIYDCDNPKELAEFYAKLLGGTVQVDPYGGHCLETPSLTCGIAFQLDEDYQRPVWLGEKGNQQPMLHVDMRVDDRKKAIEYAISLGATMPKEQFCQPDWDVQWVTLLDPAGHPFCFFDE